MKKALVKRLLAFTLAATMVLGEVSTGIAAEVVGVETIETEMTDVSVGDLVAGDVVEDSGEQEVIPESTEEFVEEAVEESVEETIDETVEDVTEEIVGEETDEEPVEDGVEESEVIEEVVTEEVIAEAPETIVADEAMVYGSNGIAYDGVTYLSAFTVNRLSADAQDAYIELCDMVAEDQEGDAAMEDVVLYINKDGKVAISAFVPYEVLYTSMLEQQEAVSENLELAEALNIEEATIDAGDEIVSFDTVLDNENYFKNQLKTSLEISLYNAAKDKMVKGSSNSFGWSGSTDLSKYMPSISTAVSAVMATYPHKFDWVNKGYDGGYKLNGYYTGIASYSWTVTVSKSKWYSSTLASQADKKATELVAEAYEFAAKSYPNAPTYGIVYYLNKWVCDKNYYEYLGTKEDITSLKSKEYFYCHSSIGCTLMGYGVCESYALTMNRLLDKAGVPSVYVVGQGGGGGHAWNYVKMPNGQFYMLDSTWNDTSGNITKYFLTAKDSSHTPEGKQFKTGTALTYPTLATANYTAGAAENNIKFSAANLYLAKGKKSKLTMDSYYDKFVKTLESSNPAVAKIDAKGNLTAVAPGSTTITSKIAGKTATCKVYVYQWSGLDCGNGKASVSFEYGNPDTVFDASDVRTYTITVNQKVASGLTAESIRTALGLSLTATSSNKKVATVSSCVLNGNTITLKVQPIGLGTAKFTVNFDGKKATISLKVAQGIQSSWFDFSDITAKNGMEYSGKAVKPKVVKSATAPKNLTFKVVYVNNVNAGTALVQTVGTGKYAGTIFKNFTIKQRDFSIAQITACTASKQYNGAPQAPSTTVKWNGKTLKAGVDYTVNYTGSQTVPSKVGSYKITVTGKGNYSGATVSVMTTKAGLLDAIYKITPAPITKMKVTVPSSVKYTGTNVAPAPVVKIGKNTLPTSDYSKAYYKADGTQVTSCVEKGKYYVLVYPYGSNVEKTAKVEFIKKTFTIK